MIYTPMTKKAMKLAYRAHHGQLDHGGMPYIFHPLHLAEQMDDEISCTAALLHDVIEDTQITADDLRKDFPDEVVSVVVRLTHNENVDYFEYVASVKPDPVAKKIKLADIAHNSDRSRCIDSGLTEEKMLSLKNKYEKAKAILLG